MAQRTPIQWCDSTANPSMGCDGCELWQPDREVRDCYAGCLTEQRTGHPGYPAKFEQVTLFPGRMAEAARARDLRGLRRPDKPWLDGMPRSIFVSDMGDSLSNAVSFEYLLVEVVLPAMGELGRRHRWLWLTKRPARLARFSAWLLERAFSWPRNLWVGTSVTGHAYKNRVRELLEVGDSDTRRFISVEPQREPVTFSVGTLTQVDWVIQGGQSRQGRQPLETVPEFHLEWARELRNQCAQIRVPYFLKQLGSRPVENGAPLKLRDKHGGDWAEWPADLRIRQVPP